jgi:phosphoesterase RecJ-like protein
MNTADVTRVIKAKQSFLLLVHHSPDGDAIASSLALGIALKRLAKNVDIVCADPIPEQFQFLPGAGAIKRDFLVGDYDVIVTLDCGDSRRTGFRDRIRELVKKNHKPLINIDHHQKNDLHGLATVNFVDTKAPSTSFLVAKIIAALQISLDYRLSTCLLTGLYTDTGGFKHENTTPEALTFASQMLSCGARLKDITTHITQSTTIPRLKLWGIALSRLAYHEDFQIVSTLISFQDMLSCGATESDIGGIANLMGTIEAEMAVLVIEKADHTVQVRMRTKSKSVNVAKLATYFGGGGQKKSAGFSLRSGS